MEQDIIGQRSPKKNTKTIIIALVAIGIMLAAFVYFAFIKKPVPPGPIQTTPTPILSPTPPQPTPQVNWEDLIPQIRQVLGPTFMGVKVEEVNSISIFQTGDITGDGVPEALVYLGSGGAYTNFLTLMMLEQGKPVAAQFKKKDGKISALLFLEGASVRNGQSAVMVPEKNAIYSGSWSISDSGKLSICKVDAYQWNGQTKIFEFNSALGKEIKPDFCSKIETGK